MLVSRIIVTNVLCFSHMQRAIKKKGGQEMGFGSRMTSIFTRILGIKHTTMRNQGGSIRAKSLHCIQQNNRAESSMTHN